MMQDLSHEIKSSSCVNLISHCLQSNVLFAFRISWSNNSVSVVETWVPGTSVSKEIWVRLLVANRTYYSLLSNFKSKTDNLKTKLLVYYPVKTLQSLGDIQGFETLWISILLRNNINMFERMILRRIWKQYMIMASAARHFKCDLYTVMVMTMIQCPMDIGPVY